MEVQKEATQKNPVEIKEEKPTPEETVVSQKHTETIKPRKKKLKGPEFRISHDLQKMEAIVREEADKNKGNKENSQDEEIVVYEINKEVNIKKDDFDKYLKEVVEKLKAQDKYTLASVLLEAKHSLNHNCWNCTVGDDLQLQLVQRETEIIPHFREKLGVKDFFIEVKVDSNLQKSVKYEPYTQEDKLKVLTKQNPALKKLQELFKTRIIYK